MVERFPLKEDVEGSSPSGLTSIPSLGLLICYNVRTMKKVFALIPFLLSLLIPSEVSAIYDPLSVPNNRFGIHIADTSDISDAARLVNTNGDWGYVTFVITKTERDVARWQKVFDELRRKHLIPIVRIATKFDGTNWEKPNSDEIDGWISFLSELNWVIKNRYVIIGNEPNHSKEWGGEVSPVEYTKYLKNFSTKLKGSSDDFFVLPAGLDASAPNSKQFKETMDEKLFLEKMHESDSEIFNSIDGWTSHSYPNPGFAAPETTTGKGSVKTYDWELELLSSLGVSKVLPVFITETGWSQEKVKEEVITKRLTNSFQNVWDDKRIVAVTPFLLNYTNAPFDGFSWKKKDGSFYVFYYKVLDLSKTKGAPIQETKGEIEGIFASPIVLKNSEFTGYILTKNTGQTIWNSNNFSFQFTDGSFELRQITIPEIEPLHSKLITFRAYSGDIQGTNEVSVRLMFEGKKIGETKSFKYFSPFPAKIKGFTLLDKVRNYLLRFLKH